MMMMGEVKEHLDAFDLFIMIRKGSGILIYHNRSHSFRVDEDRVDTGTNPWNSNIYSKKCLNVSPN
jgi:hypothetical protein